MSFNLDKILEEHKQKDSESSRAYVYKILGCCIAEDILSTTCECKSEWTIYDRYSLIKTIAEKLDLEWRIRLEPEHLHFNIPSFMLIQSYDGLYYEPYIPEGWL